MSEVGLEKDNSMQEDEIEVADLENNNSSSNTNDDRAKLNSSSTSLDKYVGKGRNSKYMTLLPEDFEPGDMDVLCGRGKRCFNSLGNQRFRKLVSARAEDYAAASTRTDKTFIVTSIVSEIRKAAPKGGFVKKDSTTGRWYEVGDFNAHEKTSQMFRDVLHESYLSSNKSKKKRRDLFRTNSKKRMITMQTAGQPTLNASSGRYMRGNVARHHSYGSVKRAVANNPFGMRTNNHSARADSFRNSGAQSVHSGHDSWHNSFQSGDGIKSEPGIMLRNNPRFNMAGRRTTSQGSLGDLQNSFGELQAQDQYQNSFGEFNNGGAAAFHNSCVEFPSSFGDANNNNNNNNNNMASAPQEFHHSFAGFISQNNNNEFDNINRNDFHNSFGELLPNHNGSGQDVPTPMHARSNPNNSGHSGHYRHADQQLQQQQQQFVLETDSVPLSIVVPGEDGGNNHMQAEQFQLEFETDENSANHNRVRHPGDPYNNIQQGVNNTNVNNLNIVNALENVGFGTSGGDDPFEPVPLDPLDMEPEPIFQ